MTCGNRFEDLVQIASKNRLPIWATLLVPGLQGSNHFLHVAHVPPMPQYSSLVAWDGLGVLVGAEARGKTRLFGDLYGFDSRPLSIFKWGFCIYDLYSKPFSRQTSAIIFRSRGPNLCSTVVQSTCERVCQNSLGSGGM